MPSSKDRILRAAMRLFGEQGYAATSVAQIEQAAGLTPGAGGLYAHFPSKKAVLAAGLTAILTPADELAAQLDPTKAAGGNQVADVEDAVQPRGPHREAARAGVEISTQLEAVARAGLARLRHDRDFNRILVRDLRDVPELLEMAAERELRPVHAQLARLIASMAVGRDDVDAHAVAAVLIAASSHFWLMTDVFGEHPAGVGENEFIRAMVQLATALLVKAT